MPVIPSADLAGNDPGWRLDRLAVLTFSVLAVLIFVQLALPPLVGLADNGDFLRVLEPVGLVHTSDPEAWDYWYYVDPTYEMVDPAAMEVVSSELLPAAAALGLARMAGTGTFDLRLLGAVHALIYLAGCYLVLSALGGLPQTLRVAAGVMLVLVAADASRVVYLNAFYGESASLVFLPAVVGLMLREARSRRPSWWRTAVLCLAVLLFSTSKVQNYWLALPLLALPVVLAWRQAAWRRRLGTGLMATATLFVAVSLYVSMPSYYREPVKWDTLFRSILVDSPDPEADLREFGLEPGLAEHVGKNAWVPGIPLFETTAQFSLGDIGRFYLRHPQRLVSIADTCAESAFIMRDHRLGNHTEASGFGPAAQAPSLTGWSNLVSWLLPGTLWFLVLLAVAWLALMVRAWHRHRELALLGLALLVMAGYSFAVAVITEGLMDTVKHLFLFQVLVETGLVAGVACFALKVERWTARGTRASAMFMERAVPGQNWRK